VGDRSKTWCFIDGLIKLRGRPFVMVTSPLLQAILEHVHDAGHEGTEKTLHRLRADIHILGQRDVVCDFVCACEVCQRNKGEQLQLTGLLQPLEVPSVVWADIAMDFVEGFPRVNGKSVILTVTNWLSMYAHFIPLGHPYTATSVALAVFDNIAHLHDIPSSIVSDHDVVFTSNF
jgi:hypothetical protein